MKAKIEVCIKVDLKQDVGMWGYGLDLHGSGYGSVSGSCQYRNYFQVQ